MLWHELTIHSTEESVEMISNFLHEAGAGGVSIEESGTLSKVRDTKYGELYDTPLNTIPEGQAVIKGYFVEEVILTDILNEIKPRIDELYLFGIDTGEVKYEQRMVDEDEWANEWKQYFKPVRVSERLTIKPTWEEYVPQSQNEKIIELDPGMAFGTGTHPTTTLCLRALEKHVQGGEEIIDVGTGSGILAVGAALLGAEHILAVDLDPVAVKIAEENSELNKLTQQITVKESDLLSVFHNEQTEPALVTLPVDMVVANILAEVILLLIDDVHQVLKSGGIFISSGIYKNKEQVVEQALTRSGLEIMEVFREEDWVAFVARKR